MADMRAGSFLTVVLFAFSAAVAAADDPLRKPPGTPSKNLRAIPTFDSPAAQPARKQPAKRTPAAKPSDAAPAAPTRPASNKKSKKTKPASRSAPALRLNPGGSTLPGGIADSVKASPALQLTPPVVEDQRSDDEAAAAAAAADAGELSTTLSRINFEGNRRFTDAQLASLVQDYLNRPVTLSDIYEASDKVSNFYVLQGYSLAVVTVPAQKIGGGVINFQVLEGVIGKIETEGNTLYSTDQIIPYLGDMKAGEIYRAAPLENSLQALNGLPGLQSKAVIKPGENPGASDIVIKVQEKRFAGTLGLDNFGRSNTGALRGTLAAQMNNPLSLADQFQFVTLHSGTGGLRYYSGAYSLAPFAGGPRIGLSYGQATFQVAGAPVDGTSRNGRLNLDFSLLNTRAHKFNLGAGATRIISSVNLAGAPQPVTSITTYDLSGSYNRLGDSGDVTAAVFSLSTNFRSNTVAACTGAGNPDCRNQMIKLDFGVQHLQPILPRFDALIRLSAAFSPEALPDSQQFSAGGPGNVRAYRSAEIRGDFGYTGSVDFRYGIPLGPVNATARVFLDAAQAHNQDSIARGLPMQDSINDVGLGLDLAYTEHFSLRVDVARPLTNGYLPSDGTGKRDTRVYASTAVSY
ncbi:MAG: POTRA domain-containing protein [Pseudomonadota bacterium]